MKPREKIVEIYTYTHQKLLVYPSRGGVLFLSRCLQRKEVYLSALNKLFFKAVVMEFLIPADNY